MTEILRVLVGSHAHGLATSESDYDYRGVYITPTSQLLQLGPKPPQTHWIEGDTDNTSYELGHFLFLATKSNPTILETFVAPIVTETELGRELLELFPYVWEKKNVFDAFTGYGYNQRTKFLQNKDDRANKYAVAWLRTLIMGTDLLTYGTMRMSLNDGLVHNEYNRLRRWKAGIWAIGEVMEVTHEWIGRITKAYDDSPEHHTDFDRVNAFLLKARKENWQ